MDKDKKRFLIIGIPIFIFIGYILFTHYIQFSVFLLIVILTVMGGTLRKKQFYSRLSKMGIFTLILYLIIFSNFYWLPSQIARRSPGGRQALIEPDNPKIKEFRDDFYEWHLDKYNVSFKDIGEGSREDIEFKLLRVDYYVRQVRCEYTNDVEAPYYHYDHIPTIDEIFESDTDNDGKLQDDCDGLTILTVSLLINMGYNAYVSECEWHWHTLVFIEGDDPRTQEAFEDVIYLYNPTKRQAYFIFNNEELFIPEHRPLYRSFYEILTGERTYDKYYLRLFNGYYIPLPLGLTLMLLYLIIIILSIGLTFFSLLGVSEWRDNKKIQKKTILRLSLNSSLMISFLFFILYFLTVSGLAFLCNICVIISLILMLRYLDYKIQSVS